MEDKDSNNLMKHQANYKRLVEKRFEPYEPLRSEKRFTQTTFHSRGQQKRKVFYAV